MLGVWRFEGLGGRGFGDFRVLGIWDLGLISRSEI